MLSCFLALVCSQRAWPSVQLQSDTPAVTLNAGEATLGCVLLSGLLAQRSRNGQIMTIKSNQTCIIYVALLLCCQGLKTSAMDYSHTSHLNCNNYETSKKLHQIFLNTTL